MNSKAFTTTIPLILLCSVLFAQDISTVKDQPLFAFSNQMQVQIEHYSANGIDNRATPFTYLIHGNPVLYIKGTPIPFSFLLSNFNNRFQQPFNQVGISPSYKWAKLHLGYRNLNFSPFTLAGQRMAGAGFELTPGKFHFGFFYGRIRKEILPDSSIAPPPPGSYFYGPGFKRRGWAAKIGVGNVAKNYFGLSMLKAGDVLDGVDSSYFNALPAPEANTVFGATAQFMFWKKLRWKTDAALSAFTRNQFSDTISTDAVPLQNLLNSLFKPTQSSQYLTALESALEFRAKTCQFGLAYRRIDPNFKSMGAYFFNSDIQQWTVNAGFRLKNGLSMRGSTGLQRDNLSALKQRTTKRLIFSAFGDYSAKNGVGVSAQFSNFGIAQNPVTKNIADTTLLEQVNRMYNLSPRYLLRGKSVIHFWQVSAFSQALSNETSGTFAPVEVKTSGFNFVYSWSLTARRLSLSPFFNIVKTETAVGVSRGTGFGLSAGIGVFKNKGSIDANISRIANRYGDAGRGSTLTAGLRFGIPVRKGLQFQLGGQHLRNKSESGSIGLPDFSEFRIQSGFTWAFQK